MFQGWAGWSALCTNATTSRIAASERRLALVLADDGVQHTGLGQRGHDRGVQQQQEQGGSCSRISPASIPDWRKRAIWPASGGVYRRSLVLTAGSPCGLGYHCAGSRRKDRSGPPPATSRRAPPGASNPPRSRSAARRRSGFPGSSRTRRSGRPARSRGARGRGSTRRGEQGRGCPGVVGVGARVRRGARGRTLAPGAARAEPIVTAGCNTAWDRSWVKGRL